MIAIKGTNFLTIHASAGETYGLDYGTPPKLSLVNNTDAALYIGINADFAEDGIAGQYMTVPPETAANNIRFSFCKVYIKSEGSGDIVLGGA